MKRKTKVLYLALLIFVLIISVISSTYAYIAATTGSAVNSVNTGSTIYSISMDIHPIYSDFSLIPMNDVDALKGIGNQCRDKYNRGVCSAYQLYVYGYDKELRYISGFIDFETNNMKNLSYMVLEESDQYDDSKCVNISDSIYCISRGASPISSDTQLSLGESYDVFGKDSKKLLLVIWLSNLDESQNEEDIGSFNASVTIQAGNGGEIKGSIASSVVMNPSTGGGDGA